MSSEFVRYTPEIETIDPHIDELLAQIIDFWEKKGRESPRTEGTGRAVRGAHAKSFGVVKADVEALADVPAAYAQGIYGVPDRHGALIRFSSTSGHLGADAQLGPGLGFAIKIFDVAGPKLVEDEPDAGTFDLVLKNNPIFIANTAKHYLFIQEIVNDLQQYLARGQVGFRELLTDFLTGKGTLEQEDWAWGELLTVGRVHLRRQNISGPENFEKGDALSFNQWRVTSDHRPLGEIMNVRRIYTASAKVRRTLNRQPHTEPTSADSVLACSEGQGAEPG